MKRYKSRPPETTRPAPEPEVPGPERARAAVRRFLLAACFFICPLVFFTNLTRNPYVTQICLLNIFLCAAAAVHFLWDAGSTGRLRLPNTAVNIPLAGACVVAALSWTVAFVGHAKFFREPIMWEGLRITLFAVVNALIPFFLAAALTREEYEAAGMGPRSPEGPLRFPEGAARRPGAGEEEPGLTPWVVFTLAWGGLWTLFPQLRSARVAAGVWPQAWDGYGALLWAGGLAGVFWLVRRGRMMDFMHLALMSGFLASAYGVLQYFNVEFIWPSILNPYGGRSVSTFGNPNFLSSYCVVLLPVAAALFLRAKHGTTRTVYAAVFLAMGMDVLASLTRSSWAGALAAILLLLVSRDVRSRIAESPRAVGLLAGLTVMAVVFWPESSVGGHYTPSVASRITEIKTFSAKDGYYSPFHQRVLIWTSAWLMGAENPITGKGWGLFELFYPFYQGHLLDTFTFFHNMRTHANNGHNEIMEVWAQTGIMGLGALLWLWTAFFRAAKRRLAGLHSTLDWTAWGAACGVAGMLTDNLLNVSLHFATPAFMFWWAAGLVMGAAYPPERPWKDWASPRAVRAVCGAAVLLLLAAGWYWVCSWFREVHYFAGFKLLRQGKAAAALKHLEQSKEWGPPEVNAIYELGNAYARIERHEDSVKAYDDALAANSGYDEIYFNIATVRSARMGKIEEALPFYRTALQINPLSADAHAAMSAVLLREPRRFLPQAEKALRHAVRFFPDNPNHWNNLGYVLSLKGSLPEAASIYARALALDPNLQVAENNLRSVVRQGGGPPPPVLQVLDGLREVERRLRKGDHSPETLALASRVASAMPKVPKARFFLGTVLLARGDAGNALQHLEWVTVRQPGLLGARLNLARAYIRLNRPAEAERELRAVLAMDPKNPDALRGLQALTGGQTAP